MNRLLPCLLILSLAVPSVVAQVPTLRINELLASNTAGIRDVDGDRSDWVEIHNNSTQPVNLAGYFLTDSKGTPLKWIFPSFSIPAKSYRIVFASSKDKIVGSEVHTNFALAKGGEFLRLSSPTGELIDSVSFGPQENDITYGRSFSTPSLWQFFAIPTPGSQNGEPYSGTTRPPRFTVLGGFHEGERLLELIPDGFGDQIRYTVDGTVPTSTSSLYLSPIRLSVTTSLRAMSFAEGKVPSPVVTQTYFFNEPRHLPVISIVTDPDGLFSNQNGIYVRGTNGIAGACDPTPRNVNRDWERAVNIEMYETDGRVGLNQGAGIKIMGGCSRTRYPQKSFSLHARAIYGDGKFRYPLFPDRPMESYESFDLRSAADDQVSTFFRDAFTQHLTREFMDSDIGAYRPTVVYINGVYWGIHNLRERQNEHYIAGNKNVSPTSLDMLEGNAVVNEGSNSGFLALRTYIQNNNLSDPAKYEYVKTQMNVDQFAEYHLANIYTAEEDWPGNNIAFWRSSEPGHERWRWIQYDRDHSFKPAQISVNNLNMATAVNGPSWPNPSWSTVILRGLLNNPEFKNRFLQLYAFHLNTTYRVDRVLAIIDTFETRLEAEMPRHITKWGGQRVPDLNSSNQWVPANFASMKEWRANIAGIREFTVNRQPVAIQHLTTKFGLSGMSQLSVSTTDWSDGSISLFHKRLRPDIATGSYFNNVPITLTATPIHGRVFSHWLVRVGSNEQRYDIATLTLAISANTQVEAVFSINTSTEERDAPFATALAQNFPNPFNPSTVIGFQVGTQDLASLRVYDLLGREVAVLVNDIMPAGEHFVTFDASNLSSGVYIYRLTVGSEVITKRMTLMK